MSSRFLAITVRKTKNLKGGIFAYVGRAVCSRGIGLIKISSETRWCWEFVEGCEHTQLILLAQLLSVSVDIHNVVSMHVHSLETRGSISLSPKQLLAWTSNRSPDRSQTATAARDEISERLIFIKYTCWWLQYIFHAGCTSMYTWSATRRVPSSPTGPEGEILLMCTPTTALDQTSKQRFF